jgi:hypothetical protein
MPLCLYILFNFTNRVIDGFVPRVYSAVHDVSFLCSLFTWLWVSEGDNTTAVWWPIEPLPRLHFPHITIYNTSRLIHRLTLYRQLPLPWNILSERVTKPENQRFCHPLYASHPTGQHLFVVFNENVMVSRDAIFKYDRIDGACSTHGRDEKCM